MFLPRKSFPIFKSVIFAFLMREMKTRFGAQKLGYLWMVAEPAFNIAFILAIFSFVDHKLSNGIPFAIFVLSGLSAYNLWTGMMKRTMGGIQANKGFLIYTPVKPIDPMIGRAIIELMIHSTVFLILVAIGFFLGVFIPVENPIGVIFLWVSLAIFAFSFGLIATILIAMAPIVEKIIQLILKPLYFISGIFYSVTIIPYQLRDLFLLNPLVHYIEAFRTLYFYNYDTSQYFSYYVIFFSSFGLLALSLGLYILKRHHLRVSQ